MIGLRTARPPRSRRCRAADSTASAAPRIRRSRNQRPKSDETAAATNGFGALAERRSRPPVRSRRGRSPSRPVTMTRRRQDAMQLKARAGGANGSQQPLGDLR